MNGEDLFIISASFLEARNGILLIVLGAMLLFAIQYVREGYRELGLAVLVEPRFLAAKAWIVFLSGNFGSTLIFWWVRHAQAHNYPDFLGSWAVVLTTFMMLITIAGGMCWIRVTMPLNYARCATLLWALIGLGALTFGYVAGYSPF